MSESRKLGGYGKLSDFRTFSISTTLYPISFAPISTLGTYMNKPRGKTTIILFVEC
jgi:hypothetical protein